MKGNGKRRWPQNPTEWQDAVDAADFFLALDAARQYGLVQGGPKVNIYRAIKILKQGRKLGYQPQPIERLAPKFLKLQTPPSESIH